MYGASHTNVELRDPIAERTATLLAAIENARARLNLVNNTSVHFNDRALVAILQQELVKILACKDALDRVVKP